MRYSITTNRVRTCLGLAILVCLFATDIQAAQLVTDETRQVLMDQEMDCIAKKMKSGTSVSWQNTCVSEYSSPYVTQEYDAVKPDRIQVAQAAESDYYNRQAIKQRAGHSDYEPAAPARYTPTQSDARVDSGYNRRYDEFSIKESSDWKDPSLTTFDIGVDFAPRYLYREPEFMRLKGPMYGVFTAVTFRTSENQHIKKAGDIFSGKSTLNMFRWDAKFSGGNLDYDSQGTGSSDGDRNYMFETRGAAGYDIPIGGATRITPYVGFGFRYLKDDSGGKQTTTGAYSYDRESFYYYLPLGVETQSRVAKSWLLEFTAEYDFFLFGKQKSHLEDVSSAYNTLQNNQDGGYGLRGSMKIIKQYDKCNIFVEPFVRYWRIEDSDIDTITISGVASGLGLEPANTTTEYGMRLGLRF